VGFVDGEGCFYIYIGKQKSIQIQASLEIAQNKHDILILKKIKDYLGCGRIKPNKEGLDLRGISRLIISNPTDIENKIRPLFDENKLITEKAKDYEDWKILIDMKKEKEHLTEEGLKKMKGIKKRWIGKSLRLEPYAVKAARTVLRGGRFCKRYTKLNKELINPDYIRGFIPDRQAAMQSNLRQLSVANGRCLPVPS